MSPESKDEAKNQSGKTFLKNGNVVLEFDEKNKTEIPIDQIKLIAEYTTANGPFVDDWFLIFYNDKSEYFEISMYAENIQEMMAELGESMNSKIHGNLASSTDWKSNIIYPAEFNGKDLWNIVKTEHKSTFEKIKSIFGINKTELKLTKISQLIIEQKPTYKGFL